MSGIFHPGSRVPARGRPGDATGAFPEELVGENPLWVGGVGVFGALFIAVGVRAGLGSPHSCLGGPCLDGDNPWPRALGLRSPSGVRMDGVPRGDRVSEPLCSLLDLSGPVNGESLSQKAEGTEEKDKSQGLGAGEPEASAEETHNK